ncbi:hypothetical protein K491DRAFT_707924 [Lophiostoma macrostomum CBS 122681]|uniref:Uncharacterized protein n=1 Tax=Lophiostoma macrostomum CBS 122681 TaxID=1314788 RepID=A0A6A6SPL7_9PLEO|nr:hypothetical protein K491DRAFT_707924 [Lophiostoma macrostomum CBS 122681]
MDQSVKTLHRDLARKYQRHGSRIEQLWRSYDQERRTEVMKAGSVEVLKTPTDTSMGNVYKLMPEWNLRDVTAPSSDFLLDMLKHRATKPLQDQYTTGVDGGLGDHMHIVDMMDRKNLKFIDTARFNNCWTLFFDEDSYGRSIKLTARANKAEFLASMAPAIRAQLAVPQATGDFILMRQQYLLQSLNIIIEDILDAGSTIRDQKERLKEPMKAATAALSNLSIHEAPEKVDLPFLLDYALDQESSLEEIIDLMRSESTVLAHAVNVWFFTRLDFVADERGRTLPAHTDDFISGAVFDTINSAVMHAAIWNYIRYLLDLLKDTPDKQSRFYVLQELSNQTNGTVRIAMKRDPESLTVENPQLHYMLRLYLHRAYPLEKDKMGEREFESLGDLAIIVTFIQSLSLVTSLPTVSNKKGKHPGCFVPRFLALDEELRQLKTGVDLSDFVIPIDNLLEPGMASGTLTALDLYILERSGTKLGFLFQDLVDDCITNIRRHNEQVQAKKTEMKTQYVVPMAPEDSNTRAQERRQKEKTRPAQSLVYDIAPESVATEGTHPDNASTSL